MYCYAQADEHGLIFSVFQSSIPVTEVPDVFAVADCDPLLLGCYVAKDGKISSPPRSGTSFVWDESTESFAEIEHGR
jgi:hypothetical protein